MCLYLLHIFLNNNKTFYLGCLLLSFTSSLCILDNALYQICVVQIFSSMWLVFSFF